jgi:hypothetical protein
MTDVCAAWTNELMTCSISCSRVWPGIVICLCEELLPTNSAQLAGSLHECDLDREDLHRVVS